MAIASSSGSTVGTRWRGRVTRASDVVFTRSATESPVMGGFPVRTSTRIAPSEKVSERPSTSSPRACSGDM